MEEIDVPEEKGIRILLKIIQASFYPKIAILPFWAEVRYFQYQYNFLLPVISHLFKQLLNTLYEILIFFENKHRNRDHLIYIVYLS